MIGSRLGGSIFNVARHDLSGRHRQCFSCDHSLEYLEDSGTIRLDDVEAQRGIAGCEPLNTLSGAR